MSSWESNNIFKSLELLVGDHYGDNPLQQLPTIKQEKYDTATLIIDMLDIQPHHNIIELGSGMGYQSLKYSEYVNHLTCLDISDSFLKEAQFYCKDQTNITFQLLQKNKEINIPHGTIDAIVIESVFIHLNIFDIFFYLKSFKEILKEKGLIYFNVFTQIDDITINRFEHIANIYYQYPQTLNELPFWNSESHIHSLLQLLNYELIISCPRGDNSQQYIIKVNK